LRRDAEPTARTTIGTATTATMTRRSRDTRAILKRNSISRSGTCRKGRAGGLHPGPPRSVRGVCGWCLSGRSVPGIRRGERRRSTTDQVADRRVREEPSRTRRVGAVRDQADDLHGRHQAGGQTGGRRRTTRLSAAPRPRVTAPPRCCRWPSWSCLLPSVGARSECHPHFRTVPTKKLGRYGPFFCIFGPMRPPLRRATGRPGAFWGPSSAQAWRLS
jgi:hypothetical protein